MDYPFKRSSEMSGDNFLVDTNFLIYLLNGRPFVSSYLGGNYFISEITEMELLGVKDIEYRILRLRSDLIHNC
jgi:predicted nucleic acid-binding protein